MKQKIVLLTIIGDISSDATNLILISNRTYNKSYSVQKKHFHSQSFRKAQKLPGISETDTFF